MNNQDTKTAVDDASKNLNDIYDKIITDSMREPISIYLAKSPEELTKLVIALNRFVTARADDAGRELVDPIMTARKAIVANLRERFKAGDKTVVPATDTHRWYHPQDNYFSGAGSMLCPVCNVGTLYYSRAAYNGHVHARCETKGCVAWME